MCIYMRDILLCFKRFEKKEKKLKNYLHLKLILINVLNKIINFFTFLLIK